MREAISMQGDVHDSRLMVLQVDQKSTKISCMIVKEAEEETMSQIGTSRTVSRTIKLKVVIVIIELMLNL